MKNSILLVVIFVIVFAGAASLFYLESKLPNEELVNRDVNGQLLKLDTLDANINELALRSRANLDANYDMLVRSTVALESTISDLSDGYFNKKQIAGSLLDTRFERFKTAMEVKVDQVENFKSSNSILRNSEKYIPVVGMQLAEQASQASLPGVNDLYNQIIIQMLEFTKQGSAKPAADVTGYSKLVLETEEQMPAESLSRILEYANHIATAIDAKSKTDQYLGKALNTAANDQIADISNAWAVWQSENSNSQGRLRSYTIGYFFIVIGLIGFLIYRLRRLYANLNQEIEAKEKEVEQVNEDLQVSEYQLKQAEKMASLGKLAAGAVQEINSPLTDINTNMGTIRSKLDKLTPILHKAKEISQTIANPQREPKAVNRLLKEQIIEYRKTGQNNDPESIDALINASSDGLQKIKNIVESLTQSSRGQDAPT